MKNLVLANSLCATLGITPSLALPERHGQICLANDSLITQATYLEEITSWGIGYADPNRNNLQALLQFLAPARTSGRMARVTVFDEDEPFQVVDYNKVKRGIGADFHEVKQRTSTRADRTVPNRGLTVRLDRDQLKEKPNWQQMHAAWLIDLLTRASILETLALYTAAAVTDTYTWDSAANPDLDIKNLNVTTLAPATGFKANRGLIGEEAALLRQVAYEPQDGAGAFSAAMAMTDAQIATRMGLGRVLTQDARYQATAGGDKDTFLGSKVLLFTAQDQESPEDASNVVRHVAGASYGGGNYAVYITEVGVKTVFVTVENYELPVVQHTGGIALITVQ